MIAFDGGSTVRDVTLDNLLAAGKIPPLVVVGVKNISSKTRQRDLNCSDEFATFLANELVPWVRKTYRVYDDPAHTIVSGCSLGGKMAAYCGLKHRGSSERCCRNPVTFLTAPRQESPTPLWEGEARGLLVVPVCPKSPSAVGILPGSGSLRNEHFLSVRFWRLVACATCWRPRDIA